MTASAALVAAVRTAKQFLTYVGSGPFQYAIAEALAPPRHLLRRLPRRPAAKRDLLADRPAPPPASRSTAPRARTSSRPTSRPSARRTPSTFCRALPDRCGVVAVPNSVFYDDPDAGRTQVRFAFCKKGEVLKEAAQRLQGLSS